MMHAQGAAMCSTVSDLHAGQDRATASRVAWVDAAKGIGIVLVVIGHALGGLIDAGITPAPDWFRPAMLVIYAFHMQLFFFLSGLFLPRRLEAGPRGIAQRAVTGLVWPYVLWGSVQILAIHAAGAYVNAPIVDVGVALTNMLFASPPSQFWFLYVLVISLAAGAAMLPAIGAGGMLTVALALRILAPEDLPVVLSFTVTMLPWFALGCLFGARGWSVALPDLSARRAALLVLVCALVLGVTSAGLVASVGIPAFSTFRAGEIAHLAWRPEAAGAALAGMTAVLLLAMRCRGGALGLLVFLGRQSMPIYLLHVLAVASTRIVLAKLVGWADPAIILAQIVAGIAGPLAAAWVARRLGLARILAL